MPMRPDLIKTEKGLTMASDPKKRQQQLARKAAKRKRVQAARKNSAAKGAVAAVSKLELATAFPIHECLVPEGLFERGIGNVFVSRKLPGGELAVAVFLVDVWCLGVKNALFRMMSRSEYNSNVSRIEEDENPVETSPKCVRKLVESAAAYAADIGFAPHSDYHWAKNIFGNIDAAACTTEFTFGHNGKPEFCSGPHDTPERCKHIMATLLERFGPDGFTFTIAMGPDGW